MGLQSYEVGSGNDKVALALSGNTWVLMLHASCMALSFNIENVQVTGVTEAIFWRP